MTHPTPWRACFAAQLRTVAILQGVGAAEMNAGEAPVIGISTKYQEPGVYTVELPCPRTRSTATVHLEMVDSNQMVFTDSFALSFHYQFHRLLKWLLVLPFVACAIAVAALPIEQAVAALPSFMRPAAAAP